VQAPRRRGQRATYGFVPRKRVIGAVALVAVVAGIAIAMAATRGGGSADPTARLAAAGCTLTTARATSRQHVTSPDAKIKYNTDPPSNGSHYYQPAIWDFYTTQANPVQVVHNEEHGGVILWWGRKVPQTTIDQLHSFYSSSPNGMLGTPYPSLGSKVAITAWTAPPAGLGEGHAATCPTFNEMAFKAFRDAYRAKGPERFPLDTLTPGS
jgi:hypothetical protein